MNYDQTLQYLYSQLPMFSRVGAAAYKKDIHNTIALCNAIGNPEKKIKTIHIAGTNGKGSTSHMIAAMLQQQGFKTGLYTSPHIKHFGERIRINGKMIEEKFVIEFTERTKELCKDIQPSFFELTVAMAFEYFSKHAVDIAVIETGLGGRLDSTNIITPILSIITNIGLDHTNLLGNTLEEIAFEKAGIIKEKTPVVIGEVLPNTKSVFEKKVTEMNTFAIYAEEEFDILSIEKETHYLECIFENKHSLHKETISIDLLGKYQAKNLRTVLTALNLLKNTPFAVHIENRNQALKNIKGLTGLQGRWDIVSNNPTIIHDVAHNKEGIQELLNQLKSDFTNQDWHFILGFVNDKNLNGVLDVLPSSAKYYFTNAHIPRALPHKELQALANSKNLLGESYDDVNLAIHTALSQSSINDVIIVCGSFFVLAEVKGSLL